MDRRGGQAVERKLLQIAFAFAGDLIAAPPVWLWLRRVAGAAQRRALT
jgi:hypothetical protein